MKPFLTIALIVLFSFYGQCQNLDLIVTQKGDSIACKIDTITSSKIYYKIPHDRRGFQFFLNLNETKLYRLGSLTENEYSHMLKSEINIYSSIDKMRYKDLKKKYLKMPYTYYRTDKYRRSIAFLLAIIPGLGHIYTGEPQRGLVFLGAAAGSFASMALGFVLAYGGSFLGTPVFLVGAAGIFVSYIWNIVDAMQIAKVKNLALRHNDISMHISPNIQLCHYNKYVNNFGVKLVIAF